MMNRSILKIAWAEFLTGVGTGITLLAIPYYILKENQGSDIFGVTATTSTIILFFLSPIFGHLIDQNSRRSYLVTVQFIGGIFLIFSLLLLLYLPSYKVYILAIIHFIGLTHFSAHFVGRSAYAQSILKPNVYKKFNGTMETVSQSSSMIGCILGATILQKINLNFIISLDIITYFAGGILFLGCPKDLNQKIINKNSAFSTGIKVTLDFFKKERLLFLTLLVGYLPFLGIMIHNYVGPVHMVKSMKGAIPLISSTSMIYSIGAIIAGTYGPKLIKIKDEYSMIRIALILFFILYVTAFSNNIKHVFVFSFFFLGLLNSFIRICRNTIIMNRVPNTIIGKVNSSFNTFGLLIRVIMITFSASIIKTYGSFLSLSPYLLTFVFGLIVINLFKLKPNITINKEV